MFSKNFEITREKIEAFAVAERHEFITVEHLLFGLLTDADASAVLQACMVDLDFLDKALKKYLDNYVPKLTGTHGEPMRTKACERVLQRAIWHVQTSGQGREISGVDVLVALFKERDSHAVALLKAQGISGLSVMRYLSHGKEERIETEGEQNEDSPKESVAKKDPLKQFTQNLNERASQGLTDPLIGRFDEIERAAQILCRRRKNNPLLVGDPGVGKTAIAEGLAWLIVNNKSPSL